MHAQISQFPFAKTAVARLTREREREGKGRTRQDRKRQERKGKERKGKEREEGGKLEVLALPPRALGARLSSTGHE